MTEPVHLKCIAEGGDGVAWLMKNGNFQWVRKYYSTWRQPDSTTMAPSDPFIAELQAYEQMTACPNLVGWIPQYYTHGDRSLNLEHIDGSLLRDAFPRFAIDELEQLYDILKEVVYRLHDVGVVHGDITVNNIMIDSTINPPEPVIIDFSRAKFPHTTSDWSSARWEDLNNLEVVFKTALREKHYNEAMRLLKLKSLGREHSNLELAEHLEQAGLYNDKLSETMITADVRQPLCVVALARNSIQHSTRWKALKFIEQHLPRTISYQVENPEDTDERSMIMLHAYKAELSGDYYCSHYLPAAIDLCAKSLGYMDNFTVSMRLKFAQRKLENDGDPQPLEALLREVTAYTPETDIATDKHHQYYEPLQRDHLIETIRDSLKLTDRLTRFDADDNFSDLEECTASCSHHVDFPAIADHNITKQSTGESDDATKPITSPAIRMALDGDSYKYSTETI